MLHHCSPLWPWQRLLPHLPLLLVLGGLDGLVNRENHAGQLVRGLKVVLFDQQRLPNKVLVCILDKVNIIEDINSPELPVVLLGVDSPEGIENVVDWEASVLGQTPGDHLKGLGIGVHNQVLFSLDFSGLHSEQFGKLHLDGPASGDDLAGLGHSPDNHDRVIE